MASTLSGWSWFGKKKAGHFTAALSQALSPGNISEARDARFDAVTFNSWFEYSRDKMIGQAGYSQTPVTMGGLGNEVVRPAIFEISEEIDSKALIRSEYMKLSGLLTLIGARSLGFQAIYSDIERKNLAQFKVVTNIGGQLIEKFVSPSKVSEYLENSEKLGLTQRSDRGAWRLTDTGKQAIARNGARYNLILKEQIVEFLALSGLTPGILSDTLFGLLDNVELPDIDKIHSTLMFSGGAVISKKDLRFALRLLSYTGYIRKARTDTFFPR